MNDFLKKHGVALVIIAVLVWALYNLFKALNTAAANLNPLAWLQQFVTWVVQQVFGSSGGTTMSPVVPQQPSLNNAFGLDAGTLTSQAPSSEDDYGTSGP
jgi:hypothetical protein